MDDSGFKHYEDEFSSLQRQIEDTLGGGENGTGFDDDQARNLLEQSEDIIKQMSLEARSVGDRSLKKELLIRVKQCKATLSRLGDEVNQQALFATSTSNSNSVEYNSNVRESLLNNERMITSQNDTLTNARRVMEETEAVALEITEELGNNRNTLQSARGRVREVTSMTTRATRVLYSMNQRSRQQKMVIYSVLTGFFLCFIVLISRFF